MTAGIPESMANAVWGFLNMVLAYNLFSLWKVSNRDQLGISQFSAGVFGMGVFLAAVFSRPGG